MGAYSYRALDPAGKTIKGILEGDSERQVRSQLRAKNLKPLEVGTADGRGSKAAPAGTTSGLLTAWLPQRQAKLNAKDLSVITRQLASLIKSGLPLDEALQATARQHHRPNIKRILLHVRTKVLEGFSLAQAMGELPSAFDDMYRAMVRAGESSGYLGPVLEKLADYTRSSQQVKQQMRSATIYPSFMMVFSLVVITVLMAFVVPDMVSIFQQSNQELPGLTTGLIAISDFVVNYGDIALLALCLGIVGLRRLLRSPARLRRWHQIKLKMPLFGALIVQYNSARFASTLSMLTSSGVPLLQALNIAGQVMSNKILQEACDEVAAAVREGSSLHRAMEAAGCFPPLLVQLVASGEANGTLAHQLEHAAEDQEWELKMMVDAALGLLPPVTVVFLGGAVVLIVLAILLPIFQMNTLI